MIVDVVIGIAAFVTALMALGKFPPTRWVAVRLLAAFWQPAVAGLRSLIREEAGSTQAADLAAQAAASRVMAEATGELARIRHELAGIKAELDLLVVVRHRVEALDITVHEPDTGIADRLERLEHRVAELQELIVHLTPGSTNEHP